MKQGTLKGIVIGIGLSVLTLSVSLTALAANRTISIDDGIRITIGGVAFAPKDAKGNAVDVFTADGTTYVPVRALAEAAGFAVSYDRATRTVVLVEKADAVTGATPDTVTEATEKVPADEKYIGVEKAKELALKQAGLKGKEVTRLKAKLDTDHGVVVYEVEFDYHYREYDYDVNAITGDILP